MHSAAEATGIVIFLALQAQRRFLISCPLLCRHAIRSKAHTSLPKNVTLLLHGLAIAARGFATVDARPEQLFRCSEAMDDQVVLRHCF